MNTATNPDGIFRMKHAICTDLTKIGKLPCPNYVYTYNGCSAMHKVPVTIQYHELIANIPHREDGKFLGAMHRRMAFLRNLIVSGARIHMVVDEREPEINRLVSLSGKPYGLPFGIYMQCTKVTYIHEDGTEHIVRDKRNKRNEKGSDGLGGSTVPLGTTGN